MGTDRATSFKHSAVDRRTEIAGQRPPEDIFPGTACRFQLLQDCFGAYQQAFHQQFFFPGQPGDIRYFLYPLAAGNNSGGIYQFLVFMQKVWKPYPVIRAWETGGRCSYRGFQTMQDHVAVIPIGRMAVYIPVGAVDATLLFPPGSTCHLYFGIGEIGPLVRVYWPAG